MANAHIGRVETIDGGVTVTPLSGSESPLTQGMPVYMNDLIKTDADASVRLRLHDGSSLLIDAGQTISLDANLVDISGSGILISEDSVTAITVTGITTVSSVEGNVQVVRGGVPRELVAGDLLYPGDTLIAAADGSAMLQLSDGSETVIEPGSQSRLGGSKAAQQEGEFLTSGIDDPAEIQAAILAGRDPSQDAPAPGVGETDSNEGHTHIRILPSGRAVTPDSGHETHGQDLPISFNIEELLQDQDSPDSVPALTIQDGTVDEAALPGGSNAASPNEAASGGFGINTGGDSVGTLVINGVDVTNGGTVAGAYGTLTVTLTNGVYSWDYLLDTNAPHPDATSTGTAEGIGEQFNVVLTDSDGDVANDVLDIAILDDGPQAVDDIAATGEEATITYNVLGNDVAGADGPATVTAASLASGQGTVTFLPNGDITVTPTAGYEGPIVVNYTIIDSDGDPASATLTVNVAPDSVPALSIQDGTVDEAALPAGSNAASPNEAASGGFGINTGGDSVGTLVINGVDVTNGGTVAGAYGTLTVTLTNGVYSWDYLLDTNAPHPDATSTGTAEGIGEQFNVVLTDSDGDVANDVLDIAILDDGPQAVDDIAATGEEATITYNVLGNDVAGADGPATVTAASLASGQGTVTFLPNGDITVTPTAGYEGPIVVNYTIIDSDGDPASATLTVNVAPDSVPALSIQDGTVDEAALPAGSNAASPNEAASGGFGINTGGDSVGTLVINGVDVTNGGTVAGAYGTLTVTLTNGVYSWDYLLDTNAPHPDATSTGTAEGIGEQFNVVLTDSDGDVANDVLDIAILDDGPQAVDDIAATGEEATITYNVLGNDVAGADGPATVTAASLASGQGTVTFLPNGDITVTPTAGYEGPIVVNYTIIDSDGDPASATLTVNVAPDSVPALSIQDGTVDEAALPAGSNAASPNEAASGGFGINTGGDSVGSLVINGVDVTNGGTVAGAYGTLTVTLTNGVYSWDYLLDTNAPHPDATSTGTAEGIGEQFNVVLTDSDGDVANDVLDIAILDDGPQAVDDIAATGEEATITYNVLGNDVAGADGPATVTAASLASGQGTVTFLPNGDITVTPTAGYEGPIVVNYTIIDSDGDPASATLTVNVAPDSVPALSIQDGTVDEAALPAGSNAASPNEAASGGFGINTGGDSVGSLVINGVDVTNGGTVAGAYGTLTVTLTNGVYSWDYLLDTNAPHPDATSTGTAEGIGEQFNVVLTDSDGDVANDVLDIAILDDGPQAVDDIAATGEEATITYNVLGNDVAGADGPATVTAASLASGQGTVTFLPNGDITVTPTAGYEGPIVVNYTIIDSDGDPASATLTVNVAPDSVPALSIQDGTVDEAALPAGSNAASPNEAASGGFGINTGGDSVGSLVINGVDVTNGGTVAGAYGTLTVTLTNGVYSWDYLLDTNAPHPDATSTGTAEGIGEQFNVVLTDSDGDVANDVLDIAILDDGPQAVDDTNAIIEDAVAPVTGAVLGNDIAGADDPAAFVAWADTAATYGTFTDTGGGNYSYVLNNSDLQVQGLDEGQSLTETFTYTMMDADGDTSAATLTITINGSNDVPTIVVETGNPQGANDQVFEAALSPKGSDPASTGEFATGIFTLSDADGLGDLVSVTINGMTVLLADLAGSSFSGSNGTLTVTAYDATTGVADYTYELTAPTTDVAGIESDDFTLTVSDGTADSLPASIIIEIVDDVPSNFEPTPVILVNSGDGSGSGPLDAFGNIGADDLGSVVFTGGTDGDLLTGLFNGNTTAEPVMYKGEEIILTGFGTGTLTGISKDSNTVILEIKLNPDTSDGSEDLYTITFFTNINDGSGIVFDNFSTAPAGQKKWVGLDSDGLDINDPADPNPDSPDLLITAYSNGAVANVNTSSTDIGANNQWITEDQVIRLDFVTDVARDTAASENERDVEGFVYDSHYAVNNFAFKVLQVQGGGTSAVRIKASNFIGTEGDTDLANSLNNTAVAIILGSLIINGVAASSLPGISVTVDGDSIVIEGLAKGDEVFFSADDTFESVEISDANGDPDGQNSTYSGEDFSVGAFNISSAVEGDEIDLSFDLLATDGDGDTATGSLDVTISPEGHVATGTDLDEVLIGDSSVDILNGGGGDDILIGNNGDDILTGGAGADIFIWTDGQSGNDTVTDFSLMEGDVLNIADLLVGENNPTAADLDNDYMSIASGSDTVITVFGNDGNADQVIQLAGYDTTGLSSVQIIENLLGNGNLLTD